MAPKTKEQLPESPPLEPTDEPIRLVITPLSDIGSPVNVSDANSASDSSSASEPEDSSIPEVIFVIPEIQERSRIPLEQNLRELLVRTANTDNLETVTQIRLRVIAREITLQHLGLYLSSLRELNLDGSVVSSLRDLGSSLRNLKILKVNRCELSCIDGVFGFENLEELYAAHNRLVDLSPCAFLMNIRVIDVKNNLMKTLDALGFLALCTTLEHLQMEGNEVDQFAEYRQTIKNLLPSLKTLDGKPCDDIDMENTSNLYQNRSMAPDINLNVITSEGRRQPSVPGRFTFRFPPRVFSDRIMSPENREE